MSATVDIEELRSLVDRIAASAPFRNSPRLKEFLLFVADRALSNHLEEITEQQVGHTVFHRSADYDTATDNIVRVSARQLRNKLRDYFDDEGRAEPLVLEIPKGGYVPHFRPRSAAVAPEPAAASPAESTGHAPPASPSFLLWRIAAISFTLLAAVLALLLVLRSPIRPVAAAQQPALADIILSPSKRTLIVLPDSGLLLLRQLTGRTVTAGEYAEQKYDAGILREVPSDVLPFIQGQQLTSAVNIGLAIRLLRLRPEAADRIAIYHASEITARNLKEGHALLLGGPRANPWAALFEEQLNFRFDFEGGRRRARILNNAPRQGELREYDSPTAVRGFARLALVPNMSKTGMILLISGTTREATEAAAEFILAPASLKLLQRAFQVPDLLSLNGFEVLLETASVGGTARESKIVTFRLQSPS